MTKRTVHPRPIKLPKDIQYRSFPEAFVKNYSHIPGQAAIIRFFDPDSEEDFQAMRAIVKGKQSRIWMDDSSSLNRPDYKEWAGTHTNDSFLFAVHNANAETDADLGYVQGFIYLYCEREEKFRLKRMENQGFLEANPNRHALEVSFAVRPFKEGIQQGSGLMSSALRQSCFQARKLIKPARLTDVMLFAFVDLNNLPAQRTLMASGFVKKGEMKYDSDSEGPSALYILNWRQLYQKITLKLREAMESQSLAKV